MNVKKISLSLALITLSSTSNASFCPSGSSYTGSQPFNTTYTISSYGHDGGRPGLEMPAACQGSKSWNEQYICVNGSGQVTQSGVSRITQNNTYFDCRVASSPSEPTAEPTPEPTPGEAEPPAVDETPVP